MPACFGILLYKNRAVLGNHASGGRNAGKWWYGDGETFHFLVDGYRQDTFWCVASFTVMMLKNVTTILIRFELVEFLRKLLMAGVSYILPLFYRRRVYPFAEH